eukprot:SAG31_NODE_3444_length_4259_cov_5.231250_2_plen_124_part_00
MRPPLQSPLLSTAGTALRRAARPWLRTLAMAPNVLDATPPSLFSGDQALDIEKLQKIDPAAAMPDELVRQFQTDGAVVLRNVFSSSWVEAMRTAAEANMATPGPLCDEHAAAQGTAGRFHDDQ